MATFTFDNITGTGGYMPDAETSILDMSRSISMTPMSLGSSGNMTFTVTGSTSTAYAYATHTNTYWTGSTTLKTLKIATGGEVTDLWLTVNTADPAGTWTLNGGHDIIRGNAYSDLLHGGSGNDQIFGNGGNDTLYGDGGDDRFDGGNGNDYIDGGTGEDAARYVGSSGRYIIEKQANGDHIITDRLGEYGIDYLTGVETLSFDDGVVTLIAPPVFTLAPPVNVNPPPPPEVSLPPPPPSQPLLPSFPVYQPPVLSVEIVGTAGTDTLVGNELNNVIKGGAGRDFMWGKAGADAFVFDTSPKSGRDFIKDFRVVDDTIHIDNADFTKIGRDGKLKAAAFHINLTGKAHDSSDRIIYDKDSGKLYYDSDGTGAKAGVCFSDINKNLKMTAADFFVL